MEQGTVLTPNRFSFHRFTAVGYWQPISEPVALLHLGVIDGSGFDEGIQREKVSFPNDGSIGIVFDEVVSVSPFWTLKGRQFMTTILPILYMGTSDGTHAQGNSIGVTRPITATLGKAVDLGPVNIRNVVVTDAATGLITYTEGLDYFLSANVGKIRFPSTAAGISDGQALIATFDQPSVSREAYIAFNNLNQQGNLLLFLMDANFAAPLNEILMPGTLSRDKSNDGDPLKTNQWALRFALEGEPTILSLTELDEWLYT